jgi:hypothetical protein
MKMKIIFNNDMRFLYLASLLLVAACSTTAPEKKTEDTLRSDQETAPPTTYTFPSRFDETQSSVAYGGQVFRHLLIEETKVFIDALNTRAMTEQLNAADIKADLLFFYEFDAATSAMVPITKTTTPALLQLTHADVQASGAKLSDKIAGKDLPGPHKDFATAFVGFGAASPDALVRSWFDALSAQVQARSTAVALPVGPDGAAINKVFVSEAGLDYKELIQKFLLASVAFSQGVDDYLDSDLAEKGLNASQERDGTNPYTVLEHQWDEGFGYFGASRDYNDLLDETVNAGTLKDTNGDGKIDLKSEYTAGHAQNASKRDYASDASAKTDFSKQAFDAFLTGRWIISQAEGALSPEDKTALLAQRDLIVLAWEGAIAATVVHYVNEVLADMGKFGTSEYKFVDHAKHWGELKGFALSFQFNPRSKVTDAAFAALHTKLGNAPVLPNADQGAIAAYKTALREVKASLGEAFDFADVNLGDDNGVGGF